MKNTPNHSNVADDSKTHTKYTLPKSEDLHPKPPKTVQYGREPCFFGGTFTPNTQNHSNVASSGCVLGPRMPMVHSKGVCGTARPQTPQTMQPGKEPCFFLGDFYPNRPKPQHCGNPRVFNRFWSFLERNNNEKLGFY